MDDEFLDRLSVHSRSKGRTPDVYWFNPSAEWRMARGPGVQVEAKLDALSRDLDNLPQFLCLPDDVVLVRERPRAFLATLKRSGLNLPLFEVLAAEGIAQSSALRSREIGTLRPWAWCPESMKLMEPLMSRLAHPAMPVGDAWESLIKPLFSKTWGLGLLRRFLATRPDRDWLSPDEDLGTVATDYAEAIGAIQRFREAGHHALVVKADFGSAGNGQVRLWEPDLLERQRAAIRRWLATTGKVVVEPWLDRVLEFSTQWEVAPSSVRGVGLVRLLSDPRGQYRGSVFSRRFTDGLSEELASFVQAGSPPRLKGLLEDLRLFLESELPGRQFTGPMGIDAMIYRDRQRRLRLKPIVEINPRFTMGRVVLELAGQVQAGRALRLMLINRPMLRKANLSGFPECATQLSQRFPLVMTGGEGPRIGEGALCLNDPATAEACLAVLIVGSPPRSAATSDLGQVFWRGLFGESETPGAP